MKIGAWILPLGFVAALAANLFWLHGGVERFAFAVVAVAALGTALLYPQVALYVFIFFSSVVVPLIPGLASVAKLAGLVCVLAFLAVLFTKRGSVWLGGTGFWLVMGLYGACVLSAVKADRLSTVIYLLVTMGFSVVAFVLFVNIVNSEERFRHVVNVILLAVIANAVVGIVEFFFLGLDRAEGLIGQANGLGYFCVFALPFCYGFITETTGPKRIYYYLAAIIIILGLVSSVSRAAFLAFFLSLALFIAKGRIKGLFYLLIPMVLFLFSLAPFIPQRYWDRMESIVEGENPGQGPMENSRVYFLKAGMQMWRENPVLGVGINHFQENYAYRYNPGFMRGEKFVSHSLYVQTLAETGSVGMLALLSLLGWSFVNIRRTQKIIRRGSSSLVRKYVAGLEIGFLVFLFTSNFSGGLLHYWNYIIIAMIVASREIFVVARAGQEAEELALPRPAAMGPFPERGRGGTGITAFTR